MPRKHCKYCSEVPGRNGIYCDAHYRRRLERQAASRAQAAAQFRPLSRNQYNKLRGAERDAYDARLEIYEAEKRAIQNEAYELSNERLRKRIDDLEARLTALENTSC